MMPFGRRFPAAKVGRPWQVCWYLVAVTGAGEDGSGRSHAVCREVPLSLLSRLEPLHLPFPPLGGPLRVLCPVDAVSVAPVPILGQEFALGNGVALEPSVISRRGMYLRPASRHFMYRLAANSGPDLRSLCGRPLVGQYDRTASGLLDGREQSLA